MCAAEFAEILRKSYWARGCSLDDVLALAKQSEEDYDRDAEVGGLVRLVKKARSLSAEESGENVSSLEE